MTKDVAYLPFGPEEDFVFGNDVLTVDRTFYDNYYRLERIDAGVLNYYYTYYADGNVKSIDGISLPGSSGTQNGYAYPNGNRLDHAIGYQAINYAHDNNGNITSDGIHTFDYNQNNRLSEVKIGTDIIARYAYNAFGRRIKKKSSTPAILFIFITIYRAICFPNPKMTVRRLEITFTKTVIWLRLKFMAIRRVSIMSSPINGQNIFQFIRSNLTILCCN